jgi:hypothetical protein
VCALWVCQVSRSALHNSTAQLISLSALSDRRGCLLWAPFRAHIERKSETMRIEPGWAGIIRRYWYDDHSGSLQHINNTALCSGITASFPVFIGFCMPLCTSHASACQVQLEILYRRAYALAVLGILALLPEQKSSSFYAIDLQPGAKAYHCRALCPVILEVVASVSSGCKQMYVSINPGMGLARMFPHFVYYLCLRLIRCLPYLHPPPPGSARGCPSYMALSCTCNSQGA